MLTCREGSFFENTINILDTILFPLLQEILQVCRKIPFLITELKCTQATEKQSPLKMPLFANNSISNRMPVSTKKANLFLNKLEFYRKLFNDGKNQSCMYISEAEPVCRDGSNNPAYKNKTIWDKKCGRINLSSAKICDGFNGITCSSKEKHSCKYSNDLSIRTGCDTHK